MVAPARGRPPQFLRRVHNRPAVRRRSTFIVFLQLLGVVSGLGVGGVAAWGVYHWVHTNAVFRLQRLALGGVPGHLQPAVRQQLDSLQGANLLLVDLDAIQRRLETVPQVEAARVRRTLPDTIEVELEPRPTWGVVRGLDASLSISAEGIVLGPAESGVGGLPEIRLRGLVAGGVGADGRLDPRLPGAARVRDAIVIHDWLSAHEPSPFGRIAHLRLEPDGVVMVSAHQPWEIAVGDAVDLDGKAANLEALLRESPPREPSLLDLRYRDMVVVKPLDLSTETRE